MTIPPALYDSCLNAMREGARLVYERMDEHARWPQSAWEAELDHLETMIEALCASEDHGEAITLAMQLMEGGSPTDVYRLMMTFRNAFAHGRMEELSIGIRQRTQARVDFSISRRNRVRLIGEMLALIEQFRAARAELTQPEFVRQFGEAVTRLVIRRIRVRLRFRYGRPSRVATRFRDQVLSRGLRTGVSPPLVVVTLTTTFLERDTHDPIQGSPRGTALCCACLPKHPARPLRTRLSAHPPTAGQPNLGGRRGLHARRAAAGQPLHRARPRQMGGVVRVDRGPRRACDRPATRLTGGVHAAA